jgi:hypothetical protein
MKFGSAPVSSELETSVLPRTSTSPEINRPTAPTTVLPAQQIPGATQALSKPKRRKVIGAITAVIAVALIANVYLYWVAYTTLGEKEEAFALLEKDIAEHSSFVSVLAVEPALDDLREDPRFKAMLRRLNLPQ